MDKKELIELVIKPIEANGGKAYFVGGCVRDELLKKEPNDYDIVTNLTPSQLHTVFDKFSNVSTNAESFGVTMPIINGEEVEIATFRKDLTKGRHPEVSLEATIEEDAMRRDFTINALYEDKYGNIIDPTGTGLSDINNNILRFVGNPTDRLSEDPLRAYRFMRFVSKGFTHPYTQEELRVFASVLNFSEVSKERKLKEIKKIFSSKDFIPYSMAYKIGFEFNIFEDMGLTDIFWDMSETPQSFKWHAEGAEVKSLIDGKYYSAKNIKDFSNMKPVMQGNVLDHTFHCLEEMNKIIFENDFDEEKRFLLVLSTMLHDVGKPYCNEGTKTNTWVWGKNTWTEEVPKVNSHPIVGIEYAEFICKKIGLSNYETEFVTTIVREHMNAHSLNKHTHKFPVMEFVHQKFFDEIMLVAQADDRGSIKTVYNEFSNVEEILETPLVKECINTPMPKPILTGDDLIERGLKPNPAFKKMLRTAYKLQIEQNELDKERLFGAVKNIKI